MQMEGNRSLFLLSSSYPEVFKHNIELFILCPGDQLPPEATSSFTQSHFFIVWMDANESTFWLIVHLLLSVLQKGRAYILSEFTPC